MDYFWPMILLRKLTVADADVLSGVGSITVLDAHGHSAPAAVMEAYVSAAFSSETCREELADARNIFYGLDHNGVLAGYYKIILNQPHAALPQQPATYMERLYVLKEHYGAQLGQQLMHHAVEVSKAAGEKSMWLNVWQGNHRAIRFYEKCGFQKIAEGVFTLPQEHTNPTWVMALKYER